MKDDAVRSPAEAVRISEELQELVRKLHQTQSQLIQSEKMASIGQLAAGVAHEINNPVGYVYSNLGSLEKYLKELFMLLDAYKRARTGADQESEPWNEVRRVEEEIDLEFLRQDMVALVRECREGMIRVKKIVQDLKDFSRSGSEEKWQVADVHKGLDTTLNIVWNELKYKCELRKEYGALPMIECLPFQLNQVFMNLLVNAAQAIPEKGVVTLRTGREGDQVYVEISDTGTGILPEHKSRLFEPFFTTKAQGSGTGLGLPVSYGIVERHRGRIEVQSEPGQGASFCVWLPIAQPEATRP
ncbi:MAG TPA: ATP-binding protein [Burkholderiales bacterium]